MENNFVKTVNDVVSINYAEINKMMKSLNRAVNTEAEYFEWVKEWKQYEASLVNTIKLMRSYRIQAKNTMKEGGATVPASHFQNMKLNLRPFARELYNLRTERKAAFKAGEFTKELEVA